MGEEDNRLPRVVFQTFIYIYAYSYICINMHLSMCVHACTHTLTHTHILMNEQTDKYISVKYFRFNGKLNGKHDYSENGGKTAINLKPSWAI